MVDVQTHSKSVQLALRSVNLVWEVPNLIFRNTVEIMPLTFNRIGRRIFLNDNKSKFYQESIEQCISFRSGFHNMKKSRFPPKIVCIQYLRITTYMNREALRSRQQQNINTPGQRLRATRYEPEFDEEAHLRAY